jgi:hypothetical protein
MKSYLPVMLEAWWGDNLPDRLNDLAELFVVGTHAGIKFFDLFGQRFLIQDHTAERDERPDHNEAHLYRSGTVEYGRRHERAVFGVGGGQFAAPTATHV